MKLGTQTASVTNHLLSRAVIGQPEPVVGMGATILSWTDRHAATVVRVFSIGKSTAIEVQMDDAKRIDSNGMSESQDYEYTRNPKGAVSTYKREANGAWENVVLNTETKRWNKTDGKGLRLGEREEYYDFSF